MACDSNIENVWFWVWIRRKKKQSRVNSWEVTAVSKEGVLLLPFANWLVRALGTLARPDIQLLSRSHTCPPLNTWSLPAWLHSTVHEVISTVCGTWLICNKSSLSWIKILCKYQDLRLVKGSVEYIILNCEGNLHLLTSSWGDKKSLQQQLHFLCLL